MAHTNTDETKKIPLGSGEVFIVEFTGSIPKDSEFEKDINRLGWIQGGASIEYKETKYEAKDDLGKVSKTITTEEEAVLKLGILTWNGNTLEKLTSTGRVSESGGKRTLKIGGITNQHNKKYAVRFVNRDKIDGDTRITIVGYNQAGFTLAYAKDKETVINPEFKAMPCDDEGTLIIYEEEILGLQALDITLAKGGTTGATKVSAIIPTAEQNIYYHIGATAESVEYGDTITTGSDWTALTIGNDIASISAGEIISVVETFDGKAIKFGYAEITADIIAS